MKRAAAASSHRRALETGPCVLIRKPSKRDRLAYLAVRRENRVFLERWEPRSPKGHGAFGPESFDRLLKFNRSKRYRKMLICLRSTGEIIGTVNFNGIAPEPFLSTTMGYWIARKHARHGCMTEAIGMAVRHAFATLGLHRVEANIMPGNKASLALIRKCGFRFEGLALRYLQINGRWADHERWAMTIEDWKSNARPKS
jgi:[ribosomal protein S5]-alanine N-acetyltransferase